MNILLVEDNVSVAESIAESIKGWNHSVETAYSGKDALAKVKKKGVDLVLLDIFLPDCKGHKLIPQFKEAWPDIGIVTMTGYNTRDLEWEVRQQGIVYYMIKPFDFKELKEILNHLSKKKVVKRDDGISRHNGPGCPPR